MFDVHVVGGGPAGCFAGIGALLSGNNVLLSEEHGKIGEPEACSGLISRSGLESLKPHVDYRKIMLNTITSARIVCGKDEFIIRPKEEVAILVSRCELDRLAAQSFEAQGGKIELGKKVTRNFSAKTIIGADGPASSIADHFGFPKISSYAACMQGNFRFSAEDPRQTSVYLSARDFPGFFGWCIPIDGENAKIGVGVALPRHPLKYYRRFLQRLGVSGKPSHEFAAVIPTSMRGSTIAQKGGYSILLAGDSAGQVKATTGGGIFFGAQCGFLAGMHSGKPKEYEKQWKQKYGLDLSLHQAFRTMLNIGGGEPHPLLFSAAKQLFFEDLLSESGRMDRWSEMVSPALLADYAKVVAKKVSGA